MSFFVCWLILILVGINVGKIEKKKIVFLFFGYFKDISDNFDKMVKYYWVMNYFLVFECILLYNVCFFVKSGLFFFYFCVFLLFKRVKVLLNNIIIYFISV